MAVRDTATRRCKLCSRPRGSAYGRFRNPTIALAAAADLDFVSLPDAPELVLLLADDPKRFRRAALRWHAGYCGELPDVEFEEAHAMLACLAGLTGPTAETCRGPAGRARPSARARAGK